MPNAPLTQTPADAVIVEIEPCDLAQLASARPGRHVLLESTLAGDPWGRWSFFAPEPARSLAYRPETGWLDANGPITHGAPGPPWTTLDAAWAALAANRVVDPVATKTRSAETDLRPPFRGGWAAAIAYDAARALADFQPWPERTIDDTAWPWFDVRLVGELVATHAASARSFLVVSRHPAFGETEPRVERLREDVAARRAAAPRIPERPERATSSLAPTPARGGSLRSNMSDGDYARAFDRLQEYLRAGDLYQANLTRRFEARCEDDAATVYARLREVARAPYSGWFASADHDALTVSPELFLARQGERIVTRPIKGTRPRHPDPERDRAEAEALRKSEKDRAEHVMIVDVHRNDLGRVCEFGSVHVETLAGLEAFPTVHHLTSTIVGTPRAGVTPWQAIAAAFPAGSITGAPKRRAIEVIEELEPTRRALYCGSMGWIGFDGDFALNVAIRTILLRGREATFQAGGGIVIDSKCETEAEETWNKARALYAAIDPTPETAQPASEPAATRSSVPR